VALNLLSGVPWALGVIITVLDVLIVLFVQQHRFRILEGIVVTLILGIRRRLRRRDSSCRGRTWAGLLRASCPPPTSCATPTCSISPSASSARR